MSTEQIIGRNPGTVPIVNLGAGENPVAGALNIDNSPYYRLRALGVAKLVPKFLVGERRWRRLRGEARNMVFHDLRKGIPLSGGSVAAVCHAHFLEHIDRSACPDLMREVFRVLMPGGVHRISVPDLRYKIDLYQRSFDRAMTDGAQGGAHEDLIANLYQESVRREAASAQEAAPLRRRLETLLLGDARRRGETHQWMYDEISLAEILTRAGFTDIRRRRPGDSRIAGWRECGADLDEQGNERLPGSLYMEAIKPLDHDEAAP